MILKESNLIEEETRQQFLRCIEMVGAGGELRGETGGSIKIKTIEENIGKMGRRKIDQMDKKEIFELIYKQVRAR